MNCSTPGFPVLHYHSVSESHSSCPALCDSIHGILQARILEWVASILLQGIFLTQGSNPGLPHYKQILYQLNHKRSPEFAIIQSLLKLMSIESVMPSNHLILCCPFSSCPKSFPSSGFCPMSQLFTSGGQSAASASVLPMNIQDWLNLGLTGFISLLSKGLSRVFSSTTVQKHQFFSIQPSLWSNSHICTWLLEKP